MIRISFVTLIIGLLSTGILLAQDVALTLDDAIAIALRDNRDLAIKAADIEKAKAGLKEARAALWPTATVKGGWDYTRDYYQEDVSQTRMQGNVTYYIYRGGQTANTIKYNGFVYEASQAALDVARLDLVTQVTKVFYTLLLSRDYSLLNKLIVDNTAAHRDYIKERYIQGQASASDVLAIESELASVTRVYEESLGEQEQAAALLANLLNASQSVAIKPAGEFHYERADVVYDEAFMHAMQKRPEFVELAAEQNAAKAAVEIAKAGNRPTVSASWDYYARSHEVAFEGLVQRWNDYQVVGITVSWPIFDGWATKAKVEGALADLRNAQLKKEKTAADIALEVRQAYVGLKIALPKIAATEAEVKLYADNLETAKEKYAQGLVSALGQSDAQVKNDIARFNKEQALYDYVVAKADLIKATGG